MLAPLVGSGAGPAVVDFGDILRVIELI